MMIQILNYFIESSIILAVLYFLYFFLFRQYKNFLFNRSYLILSMIFALVIPLLDIPLFAGNTDLSVVNIQQALQLPTITIREDEVMQANRFEYSFFEILGFLYLAGVLSLLIRFLIRFGKLFSFIRTHKSQGVYKEHYTLVYTEGKIATCSFFNYLLWDDNQKYSEEEAKLILEHEETHIRHRHSYDIVFAELLIIFFWFHPLVYLYRSSLSALHEYIADQKAAALTSPSRYISLLSLKTLRSLNLRLGNNFHQTQIFNRMSMLKREKKRSWWSRIALTTPVFAILFYVFACGQQSEEPQVAKVSADLPEGMILLQPERVTPEVKDWYDESMEAILSEKGGEKDDFYLVTLDKNKADKFPVEGSNIQIRSIWVNKKTSVGEQIYAIVEKAEGFVAQNDMQIRKTTEDEVFTVVEEPPVPQGGLPEFYQYVAQNLKYPREAQAKGIAGKVYIEFIVDKDGSITEVKTIKGIGGGCDQEAVRVIQNAPKWTPGKQRGENVKVKMTLPVDFQLDSVADSDQG